MKTQSESFFHFELNKVISLYPVYDSSGDFTHKWVDSNGTDYTDEVDHGTCVEESVLNCADTAQKMQYFAYRASSLEGVDFVESCDSVVYVDFDIDVTDVFGEEIVYPPALEVEEIALSLDLEGGTLENQIGDFDSRVLKYQG